MPKLPLFVNPADAKVGDYVIVAPLSHSNKYTYARVSKRTEKTITATGETFRYNTNGFYAPSRKRLIAPTPEIIAELTAHADQRERDRIEGERRAAEHKATIEANAAEFVQWVRRRAAEHKATIEANAAEFVQWVRDGGDIRSVLDTATLSDAWKQVQRQQQKESVTP